MSTLKKLLVAASLPFALAGVAFGHAISIGYENAGPGAVTIWLGTYSTGHAAITTEGSLNLVGVLGNPFVSTTVAFTTTVGIGAGFKPSGLIDGTTNFYAPNTTNPNAALVGSETGFNIACPACGPVDRWQGVTFTGLSAGSYQFTWVPIANPTAQWDIINNNMNGIFDLTGVVQPPSPNGTPDGGTTFGLFGGALAVLGAFARRFRK